MVSDSLLILVLLCRREQFFISPSKGMSVSHSTRACETLTQCWFDVDTQSATLTQPPDIGGSCYPVKAGCLAQSQQLCSDCRGM